MELCEGNSDKAMRRYSQRDGEMKESKLRDRPCKQDGVIEEKV